MDGVYVDTLRYYPLAKPGILKRGVKWCHMYCKDLKVLHNFARRIGMKKEWFQDGRIPHYDLTPAKRSKAIEMGAIPCDVREIIKIAREFNR